MAHTEDETPTVESTEAEPGHDAPPKRSSRLWRRKRKKPEDVAETRNNYPLF